jgi:lipopolysaccharide transport system ATP-binding protein
MKDDVVISGKGLGKRYTLGAGGRSHDSLRELLVDGARSLFRRGQSPKQAAEPFWALRDVSFDIRRGENVGIIGLNGAGKSTLLKIMSRITVPTAGTARVAGRVGALLEVGTGFHGELTGRENAYLYGAILGMGKQEISRKFDAIVEFSGIKDFIDTPVKRYSSGMYVRLAFAVAAHLEPDILLLDEVLSVGDLPFQRKCMEFAKRLQERNATILFVSHNMFSIKTMCSRVIYLKRGRVQFDGPTDAGIEMYEEDCRLSTLSWAEKKPDEWPIKVTDFSLLDESGTPKTVFEFGDSMRLRLEYEAHHALDNPNFIIAFIRSDGVACCNFSSEADGLALGEIHGKGVLELQTPPLKLVSELYTISILIREKGFQRVLCAQIGSTFHVRHELYDTHFGVFHEPGRWVSESNGGVRQAC